MNTDDLQASVRACIAHLQAGRLDALEALARSALSRHPQAAVLWQLQGVALLSLGRLAEALTSLRKSVELVPANASAWDNLGVVLQRLGEHDDAALAFERSLSISRDVAGVWSNAAANACDLKRYDVAIAYAERALVLDASLAPAALARGNALSALGRLGEAADWLERAVMLAPGLLEAHASLGGVYAESGRHAQAVEILTPLATLSAGNPVVLTNLAQALYHLGRIDEALAHFRAAIECGSSRVEPWNGYLFTLTHMATVTPEALHAAHVAFGDTFEGRWRDRWGGWDNDRDPQRRLRIGFVSGDLRNHAIAHFIEPIWAALDRGQFELHAYHTYPSEDATSERLRALVAHWSNVHALTDDALEERIRADRIDILFDLSGHTAYNRLPVFARKPAPIQISWVGYPGTTGLRAVDYRFVHASAVSEGQMDPFFTERLVRLELTSNFAPYPDLPDVSPLPALDAGVLTFASFNRPAKLGREAVALWARVLAGVPRARMLIGAVSDAALESRIVELFHEFGIERARLAFKPRVDMQAYLSLHHEVDLILDTLPYSGGTTTHHALWMGVPTLTLAGSSLQQRQGAGILARAGLPEWITYSEEVFVAKAIEAARDLPALAALRMTLRPHLRSLTDGVRGADIGVPLRALWRRWCEGRSPVATTIAC